MRTKNKQTEAEIRALAKRAFPEDSVTEIRELTEGMCNAAYLVGLSSGRQTVLKIAAPDRQGLMLNEADLMATEVAAMQLVGADGHVRVPEVYYADFSKEVCSGTYFFMEALEGASYASLGDGLPEEVHQALHHRVGQIERAITSIKGTRFGSLVEESRQYDRLYDWFYELIANVLTDAKRKDIWIGVPEEKILAVLQQDREIFEAVTQPVLVHWDMWEGNIFVKDREITGVIDWERAMWGEAYMDDRFRSHSRTGDFLRGYGQEQFSGEEWRRIYWYDVYLYLTMMTEGAYREYADDGVYQWAKPMFEQAWEKLGEK
ncbi:MAG: aminoglycoside phosphotransferase family protein [Lachnospiraceae bacterium]|nr:aminoglycoside phosphotransferase family protein [Lachnospiraceae bacterium]